MKSFETSFHQDLNGDGTIGDPVTGTVIEAAGSTSLVETSLHQDLNEQRQSPTFLWQPDNGTPAVLDHGRHQLSRGAALPNPGPTWHVAEAADFNGDGNSDILSQHDSGAPAIWTMDGTNIIDAAVLPNPGHDWHII